MFWRWYRSAVGDSTPISLQCQLPQEMREAHAKSVRSQPETLGRGSLFGQTRCVYNNRLFPKYIVFADGCMSWMYVRPVTHSMLNVCVCRSVMVSQLRIRTNNSLSNVRARSSVIIHHSSVSPFSLFVQIPRAIFSLSLFVTPWWWAKEMRFKVKTIEGDAPAHAVMLLDATRLSLGCFASLAVRNTGQQFELYTRQNSSRPTSQIQNIP
jgi:hypothetical protein